jgi:UDP-N-acetyl-D-glucosamine dehydrogenase
MRLSEELARKIEAREAVVGVIGLGYVGLPLVREFCNAGFKVTGFDIDPKKVSALKAGKSYIEHLPADIFNPFIKSRRFAPTSDMKLLGKPDAIIICVPTPLDKMRDPDMTFIRSTGEEISRHLRRGQLIVLESTTYPGTTREVVQPLLDGTGLRLPAAGTTPPTPFPRWWAAPRKPAASWRPHCTARRWRQSCRSRAAR